MEVKMHIYRYALALALSLMLAACATTAKRVEVDAEKLPEPKKGEVAVLGSVRLIEFVVKVPLPTDEQDSAMYLRTAGGDKKYKVKCSGAGDFGVYLPVGSYKVYKINVAGYTFAPDSLTLDVPKDNKAAYAGAIVLDGSPTGVDADTDRTIFVYSVKDEYKEFLAAVKDAVTDKDVKVARSLFKAGDSRAVGSYPNKVLRAEDVRDKLEAGSKDVEEAVGGVLISLPYIISPVWILSLP
jgi:hypothetical protein